jgi:hypothetical protein
VSVYSVIYFISVIIQNVITHANEIYVYMYVKIMSNDSHEDRLGTVYTGCGKLTSFFVWVYSY